jgi:hypothetical protein
MSYGGLKTMENIEVTSFYEDVKEGNVIIFMYTNWKGVLSKRKAIIKGFFIGKTDFHTDYQFFIKAIDLDKLEERDFAVNDISALQVVNV